MTGCNVQIGPPAVNLVADGTGVPETPIELLPIESININPISVLCVYSNHTMLR